MTHRCGYCKMPIPAPSQLNIQHQCKCGALWMVITGRDGLQWLHIGNVTE